MALLLCLLGSGCAGTWPWRESASVLPRHADRDAVAALDNWVLNGRVGIQHHDQGVSADLQWRQAGQRFELRIGAPLNGGTFVLEGGADVMLIVGESGAIPTHVQTAKELQRDHGTLVINVNPDANCRAAQVADVQLSMGAREALLALIADISARREFAETFLISAEKGDGVKDLKAWLAGALMAGKPHPRRATAYTGFGGTAQADAAAS